MSCVNNDCNNECEDPCVQNPCYSDCGCLNPTTFECITQPGNLDALSIVASMNGLQVLGAINTAVNLLQADKGKVMHDESDACPGYIADKLGEGTNISFSYDGVGCERKLIINAIEGGVPIDVNVKVSTNDTTSGRLTDKIQTGVYISKTIISPAGNEKLKFDVVPATLISGDAGNQLTLGDDGALKTLYTAPDGSETKVQEGSGVTISGSGTLADPYVISTDTSIQHARPCFDGEWRDIPLSATGNASVIYISGQPQYRYRFDGTIEFRGSATYTVSFGNYQSANRKFTIPVGSLPTSCVTVTEQNGTKDLKGINYIDSPQAGADQYTQLYGYIIRKANQNIQLEFQSSFIGATSKTIVVNFEGAVSHPII